MATTQITTRDSFQVFAGLMNRHEDFKTYGNLSGSKPPIPGFAYTGQMPTRHSHFENWAKSLRNASFIVWSYSTPIAWFDSVQKYWIMPDVKYSVTTSKAQGKIGAAVSILNNRINNRVAEECAEFQALDARYGTHSTSPLHHSNRCMIPGHNVNAAHNN